MDMVQATGAEGVPTNTTSTSGAASVGNARIDHDYGSAFHALLMVGTFVILFPLESDPWGLGGDSRSWDWHLRRSNVQQGKAIRPFNLPKTPYVACTTYSCQSGWLLLAPLGS